MGPRGSPGRRQAQHRSSGQVSFCISFMVALLPDTGLIGP
jgi:hypothetical protein